MYVCTCAHVYYGGSELWENPGGCGCVWGCVLGKGGRGRSVLHLTNYLLSDQDISLLFNACGGMNYRCLPALCMVAENMVTNRLTDWQTHKPSIYCNPCCACKLRVNQDISPLSLGGVCKGWCKGGWVWGCVLEKEGREKCITYLTNQDISHACGCMLMIFTTCPVCETTTTVVNVGYISIGLDQ